MMIWFLECIDLKYLRLCNLYFISGIIILILEFTSEAHRKTLTFSDVKVYWFRLYNGHLWELFFFQVSGNDQYIFSQNNDAVILVRRLMFFSIFFQYNGMFADFVTDKSHFAHGSRKVSIFNFQQNPSISQPSLNTWKKSNLVQIFLTDWVLVHSYLWNKCIDLFSVTWKYKSELFLTDNCKT